MASDDRRLSEAEVQGLLRRLEAGGHWSASFKRRLLLTALDALKARDEAALGLERYAKAARDAQREVEEMRSTLRRRPNHDETISAMLDDEVIERLGLDGRHSALQVTRLCDELNRLREAQPRWVRCSERLPEEPGLYCVRVLDISLGDEPTHNAVPSWELYDDEAEEWQLSEDWFPVECWRVTHWLPGLPPLPEEDA